MFIYVYLFVLLLNILCVLIFNKRYVFLDILSIVFVIIAFVFKNNNSGDLLIYKTSYYSNLSGNNEIGYELLMHICRHLGLSFTSFKLVICLVSISLLYISCKKVTSNYPVLFISSSTFLVAFLGIALRFCIGFSIAIYALSILISSSLKLKDIIKFIIIIFVMTCDQ